MPRSGTNVKIIGKRRLLSGFVELYMLRGLDTSLTCYCRTGGCSSNWNFMARQIWARIQGKEKRIFSRLWLNSHLQPLLLTSARKTNVINRIYFTELCMLSIGMVSLSGKSNGTASMSCMKRTGLNFFWGFKDLMKPFSGPYGSEQWEAVEDHD